MKFLQPVLATLLTLSTLFASNEGLVVKQTNQSVNKVIEHLNSTLSANGFTIFAVIDHAAGAKKVGLMLRDEQLIIFGNPKGGTLLMNENANFGIDLPMKILAYSNEDGSTNVVYNNPIFLQERYGVENSKKIIGKMQGLFSKLMQGVEAK
jgi:uncharacterized protein (DUF302 family)